MVDRVAAWNLDREADAILGQSRRPSAPDYLSKGVRLAAPVSPSRAVRAEGLEPKGFAHQVLSPGGYHFATPAFRIVPA